jgi:hypothetical protein
VFAGSIRSHVLGKICGDRASSSCQDSFSDVRTWDFVI